MKLLKFLVLFLLIFFGGFIVYFVYTMTIGDTYGLYEKLENLEAVVSVENYYTYEGRAFFTLLLSDNRLIALSSVGNQDLVSSDGMMIDQVGPYKIMCKDSSGRSFGPGIHTKDMGQEQKVSEATESVPNLIKYYDDLEELFEKMPIRFSSESDSADAPTASLFCKDAKTEQMKK